MLTGAGTGAWGIASDDPVVQRVNRDLGLVIVLSTNSRRAVAIVTGGSCQTGRDVARGLASSAWAIVVVYLEHQSRAEATVTQVIAAEGTTVAVRADLADDLDVQRLFTESIAAFGGVDVVVHTTTGSAALLLASSVWRMRMSCWRSCCRAAWR